MNWLAHIVLAGEDEDDQLGGVLADLLSMPKVEALSPGLRRGVALHHAVDAFCDGHPAVWASNRRIVAAGVGLRPAAAAIAVDMLYDHLLARDWERYGAAGELSVFSARFYELAARRAGEMPAEARTAFALMRQEDWLGSYWELGEIREVLERIRRRLSPRAQAASPLANAVEVFVREGVGFAGDFAWFWPEAVEHVAAWRQGAGRR